MKYFTPQLWLGFNGPRSKAALGTWNRRFEAYQTDVTGLILYQGK